jgi:hypothetical protein
MQKDSTWTLPAGHFVEKRRRIRDMVEEGASQYDVKDLIGPKVAHFPHRGSQFQPGPYSSLFGSGEHLGRGVQQVHFSNARPKRRLKQQFATKGRAAADIQKP